METKITNDVASLSRLKAGRYHTLFPFYKQNTLSLLNNLAPKGENSFDAVFKKVEAVYASKGEGRNYIRSITSAFVPKAYTSNEITELVCAARAKHKLAIYKGNIHKQCLDEIYNYFIITIGSQPNPKTGKNERTFRPVFKLLIE